MSNFTDIIGNVYGRLVVIGCSGSDMRKETVWICQCSCGKTINAKGWRLKSGHTSSCGCLRKDTLRARSTTHGKSCHPLYNAYKSMKRRCNSTETNAYPYYLSKGIKVCNRWADSVDSFIEDMCEGYAVGLQLDRINPDVGYSKENCRWVTPQQNQMNTSSRVNSTSKYKGVCWFKTREKWVARIMINGKTKHLGYFLDELDAALAYNEAAKELFGEYAHINDIPN